MFHAKNHTVDNIETSDSDSVVSAGARRRPLRRLAGTAVLAAGLTGTLVALAPVVSAAPATTGTATATSAFLAHLNGLRESHGLAPLSESSDLMSIALEHSYAMEAQGTIFHNPNLATQVTNWEVVGENVGEGPSEPALDSAFDASPEHYANETNTSYTQVGIGAVTAPNGEIYVTLDFRMPMNATPAPVASHPTTPTSTTPTHSTAPTSSAASQAAAQAQARAAAAAKAKAAAAAKAKAAAAAKAKAEAAARARVIDFRAPAGNDPVARALAFASSVARL